MKWPRNEYRRTVSPYRLVLKSFDGKERFVTFGHLEASARALRPGMADLHAGRIVAGFEGDDAMVVGPARPISEIHIDYE